MVRILCVAIAMCATLVSASWAGRPVVIGVYLPMTGEFKSSGEMAWAGIQAARKMRPQVLGRDVELRLADTKSDKVEASTAITGLIEKDKAVAIIGELTSGSTISGADHAERNRVPMITPTATGSLVTQNKKYVFRTCFLDSEQAMVAARIARDRFKAKTASLIYDISQDYGIALSAWFKREFTKAGGKIAAETIFRNGDKDFTSQVNRIKSANPDVIYAPLYYDECALFAKQAREMGLNAPMLAGDGVHSPELIARGGKAVEDLGFTAHFHKDMVDWESGRKFLDFFRKETGKELEAFSAMSADTYFIVLDAIERAGSDDPAAIRDAMAATKDFEGITGKISLKTDGNAARPMVLNKVKDGVFVYVATINP